ncbi:unnamed protein product, partial [Candidula unifasciata]
MEAVTVNHFSISDLTTEEQQLLWSIQERKKQLILEIQELKRDIEDVTHELEGLDLVED